MGTESKCLVITGSTRGIGRGLADALLRLGCRVAVSGRSTTASTRAAAELAERHAPERVLGVACDVTRREQVQALWDAAAERFGHIDIWINNAGLGQAQIPIGELDPELIQSIVATNVTGALFGMQVAVQGMQRQGGGTILNMEGLGSDGRHVDGLAVYGCTKRALAYLTDAQAKEAKALGVVVGAIRPGMIMTDMITEQYAGRPEEWARAQKIFNIIADDLDTVAPWIARRVLEVRRPGQRINWLTNAKVAWRFATAWARRR